MKTYFTEISLSVLTAIFPGEPGLAGFITAKDDGSGGDNYSYKTCKAPVKSSPPTPSFLQALCRFCHPTNGVKDQRCQSTENESRFTEMLSTTIPRLQLHRMQMLSLASLSHLRLNDIQWRNIFTQVIRHITLRVDSQHVSPTVPESHRHRSVLMPCISQTDY